MFETRMTSGNLGDIVVWGADNDKYPLAVKNNLLFGWEDDNVLDEYGPYIKKNMPDALKKNKELTKTITNGASDKLYGFGANVALNLSLIHISKYLHPFLEGVVKSFIGCEVVLSDGEKGTIVAMHADELARPSVCVSGKVLDLREMSDVTIQMML